MSHAQKAVWFAHQQDPTGLRYTCAEHLTIDGPLDGPLLRRAWAGLCAEADVLRVSRIGESADGELHQVLDERAPELLDVDLRRAADPDAAAVGWMHHDLDAPLDLAAGPVSLAALLRVADDRHLLYLRMHHAVTDGYSMHLMQGTLADLYTALLRGRERTSPPLGDLATLIAKDTRYRRSADFDVDRAFWTGRFADSPEPMRLPAVAVDRESAAIRAREVRRCPPPTPGVRRVAPRWAPPGRSC
ncbi:hypothetical protein K7G98_01995 [Saccharothrix sp. MB29]|nr:hypothetical protein [Saccharothrix sp. MB29]